MKLSAEDQSGGSSSCTRLTRVVLYIMCKDFEKSILQGIGARGADGGYVSGHLGILFPEDRRCGCSSGCPWLPLGIRNARIQPASALTESLPKSAWLGYMRRDEPARGS